MTLWRDLFIVLLHGTRETIFCAIFSLRAVTVTLFIFDLRGFTALVALNQVEPATSYDSMLLVIAQISMSFYFSEVSLAISELLSTGIIMTQSTKCS